MLNNTVRFIFVLFILIQSQQNYSAEQTFEGEPFVETETKTLKEPDFMNLTSTQAYLQMTEFHQTSRKVSPETTFLDHVFQSEEIDDFHFTVPVDQQIAIQVYCHEIENNRFSPMKNLSTENPIKLTVFQGNHSVVQSIFFFQKYIVLDGSKNIKYSIRFETLGGPKLIVMSLKLFVEKADILKVLDKSHANIYSQKTNQIKNQLFEMQNRFRFYWMIHENKIKQSAKNVAEILIVIVSSFVQVRILFQLLKGNSIII